MSFKNNSIFYTDSQDPDSYSLENQIAENLEFRLARNKKTVTKRDTFEAIALSIRDRMIHKWQRTQSHYYEKDVKKIHYLSIEYLMGRLLTNSLINLNYYDECKKILSEIGYDLDEIVEMEKDMGLGNGGLGRLASCFLESMASLELPAYGYGIRYEFGIFNQAIENGFQVEKPDSWLGYGSPWELIRPEHTYRIKFYGKVHSKIDLDGRLVFEWLDTEDVLAVGYDIPVPGFKNNTVNSLRLWQAKADTDFDLHEFQKGNYIEAVEDKVMSENISKVLYPNDNQLIGKELRLKQEYFFVSATIQDILKKYKRFYGDFSKFADKNAIQLNDTHPALAIPEMMRILIDDELLGWDEAWSLTTKTFAYTNHTILAEALEKWSVSMFEKLLPRHLQIIYEINYRFIEGVKTFLNSDLTKLRAMSIIDESSDKKIRMANLAIIGSHSVNGVSEIHTEIIKKRIFPEFYEFQPEKFNNKTNGISQRRWLQEANPLLSGLIKETIGDGWIKDLNELKKLEKYSNDAAFIQKWQNIKKHNKDRFVSYIKKNYNIELDPHSLFDVQIKRFHEYKRQLLNVLHIITLYNRIKDNPNLNIPPRTIIIGGKAAPGYHIAKLTIKLINSIADIINHDKQVNKLLKVVFLKNYSVSLAELVIPATDLSEHISTAGFEASGTSNMKFQLNGSLIIGTLDGANIEIKDEVGNDNIFIFGNNADEITQLKAEGYNSYHYYQRYSELKKVIDMLTYNYFNPYELNIFTPVVESLLGGGDKYCLFADYDSYIKTQTRAGNIFKDNNNWATKSIMNTARSGKFSSDRTINEYAKDIWNVGKVKIK